MKNRDKALVGVGVLGLAWALSSLVPDQHRASSSHVAHAEGVQASAAAPAAGATRHTTMTTPVAAAKTPPPPKEADEDWVVDYDFTTNQKPEVVWTKEEKGYKVVLDSSGQIFVSGPPIAGFNGAASIPDAEREHLRQEAREMMREELPMKPRAVWEREEAARQAALEPKEPDDKKPVDFAAKGYKSEEEYVAAYRKQHKIAQNDQVSVYMRKNEKGEYEERVLLTAQSPGEF